MIDTIRLVLDISKIPENFKLVRKRDNVLCATMNPTDEMKASGRYYPKLSYIERPIKGGFTHQLFVEFSIPKLLMNNNFCEVGEKDFDDIVERLKYVLREMDVAKFLFSAQIENFKVVKVDYSKNIVFDDGTSVSQILRQLNSANIQKYMDVSSADFRNGGQILHYHTGARDIVFYDKVADLKQSRKSEKRCVEKDYYSQKDWIKYFEDNKKLSVLRFEIRLNGVKQIKTQLKNAGQEKEITFKELFSAEVSQAILMMWWNEIFSRLPKAPLDSDTTENQFIGILQCDDAKPQAVLATLGMIYLMGENGVSDARFAREMFDRRFKNGSWSRTSKLILEPKKTHNLQNFLKIEQSLKEMKPVQLDVFRT